MILISQDEAAALRRRFGDRISITITNKQKKGGRKKYYVEETDKVVGYLNWLKRKVG